MFSCKVSVSCLSKKILQPKQLKKKFFWCFILFIRYIHILIFFEYTHSCFDGVLIFQWQCFLLMAVYGFFLFFFNPRFWATPSMSMCWKTSTVSASPTLTCMTSSGKGTVCRICSNRQKCVLLLFSFCCTLCFRRTVIYRFVEAVIHLYCIYLFFFYCKEIPV